MKLTCPACGAAASLDVLIANDSAREAVMAALLLPAPLGKLLVQYLGLFRPAKRQLSFDRVAALLNELQPMIGAGRIERGGRVWAAPVEAWRMALEEMAAKRGALTLPLKSHGYLLAIIVGYTDKAEARAEAQEENRRAGRTPVGGVVQSPRPSREREEIKKTRGIMPTAIKEQLGKFKTGVNNDNTQ